MKALDLYWFSGTGNTWLAADALAVALRARGVTVVLHRIEAAPAPDPAADATLGLAFPVACFSTYPLVWRFLERLPPGADRAVVALGTMGGASAGMSGPLGDFLRRRGYRALAARMFVMPGNYNNRTLPAAKNAALVARMRAEVVRFADELVAGRAAWPRSYGAWSRLMTRMARSRHPWAFFKRMFPLTVNRDRCTRCGLCVQICPAGVIRMDDGPVWSDACESCQRCVGYCPAHAIHVPGKPAEQYRAAPLEALREAWRPAGCS